MHAKVSATKVHVLKEPILAKKATEPTTNPAMLAAHPQKKYAEPKTWLDLMILKLSSNLDDSVGDLGELKVGGKGSRGGSCLGHAWLGARGMPSPGGTSTRGCPWLLQA